MYIKAKVVFEDEDESEDFFCPVCDFPLATGEDFLAYKNYNCCRNRPE